MIVALSALPVILRSPLTATVFTMPSFIALPPNSPIIRPSIPSNFIWDFSVDLTSADDMPAADRSPINMTATTNRARLIFVFLPLNDCPGAPGADHAAVSGRCLRRS